MNKFSFYTGITFSVALIVLGIVFHKTELLFEGIGIALGMMYGFITWGFALQHEKMRADFADDWVEHLKKERDHYILLAKNVWPKK